MKLTTSYQREINEFAKVIASGDFNIRQVTAGALTQARAKLNPWAFKRLRDVALETFYRDAPYNKWKNMRLLAVDGSVINLPSSKSVIEEFGSQDFIRKFGTPKSMARASLLYDVLNHVTLDAQLSTYNTSEKALFKLHLEKIQESDLILADRAYGITPILHWLNEIGAKYCIRFRNDKHNVISKFVKSGKVSEVVNWKSKPYEYQRMGMPRDTKSIEMRLVRVILDSGEIEILGTNLFDKKEYPSLLFKELYFKRWQVEEAYKQLKTRINLEAFSGKTARSIHQDFHAKILMMTLCATLAHPIAQKIKEEYSAEKTGNKYDQQINKADSLAQTKASLVDIFLKQIHQKTIDVMDFIVESSRTIIRPNRKSRRNKQKMKRKTTNHKPI